MIKQHCDVCDRVIEGTEGYRTIHFGRGYNTDVNTGFDPLVVCKDCWYKMLESQGRVDLYKGIDSAPKKPVPVGNVKDIIVDIVDKRCKTCKYGEDWSENTPCKQCADLNKWEKKD
jgi:hypothetical protein